MGTWLILILAVILTFTGLIWLALAMKAHWKQVYGQRALGRKVRLMLRGFGISALLLSAVLCFIADRPSMAVLVWIMLLAAAAPSVAFTLAWRPALLRGAWPWK